MPRENRKRGKKHKKKTEEVPDGHQDAGVHLEEQEKPEAGPSWIVPAHDASDATDPNAPFGYVDAEVKAYFRTVDVQIREWQDERAVVEENADVDPNEDRRMFFVAALSEMSGKEKQLATDPDCSTILERMVHSMDDFVRRVFMDRISGSFEQLSRHRFASHVCQTLLTVAADTVSREARGVFPPESESQGEEGELRTLTQLTLDMCDELLPSLSSLVLDPFASHVIRALLLLLAPDVLGRVDDANASNRSHNFSVRSKKSAAYKARQGPMKSVFVGEEAEQQKASKSIPKEFRGAASSFVAALREQLGENEVRALAANQVASPVLQMLLELEAAYGEADAPGSIMDHVLVGLITSLHHKPEAPAPESDYLMTLLRDPTASHLLETLVSRSPERVFAPLWQTYFVGKLARLAVHPVANYVVAKAFERLGADQLQAALQELQGVGGKIVKNARTGVLRALVDRSAVLQNCVQSVIELVSSAFDISTEEDNKLFVPCLLVLKPLAEYQRAVEAASKDTKEAKDDSLQHKRRKPENPLEAKTQGALLLQSILRLPAPHVEVVLNSLQAIGTDEVIKMAHNATSSRVLDAVLESPTVPHKDKGKFVMTFLGHYHILADDRIGSRVAERCWAFADTYLKEKIARSVIPHEHALAGSAFGKFFARPLSLHILQRDPERWKTMQAANKAAAAPSPAAGANAQLRADPSQRSKAHVAQTAGAPGETHVSTSDESQKKAEKRARKAHSQDEIDALFEATLGKKVKKAELATANATEGDSHRKHEEKEKSEKGKSKSKKRKERDGESEDRSLQDVLGAIRAAPKDDKGHKKKRTH
ncbi:ARM repeat-containing protein [Trametes elegans]|nr:ARM repeat-containing protein [Trametes elegans]